MRMSTFTPTLYGSITGMSKPFVKESAWGRYFKNGDLVIYYGRGTWSEPPVPEDVPNGQFCISLPFKQQNYTSYGNLLIERNNPALAWTNKILIGVIPNCNYGVFRNVTDDGLYESLYCAAFGTEFTIAWTLHYLAA